MKQHVGQYYLDHLHATAGPSELLLRALERSLVDLENDRIEAFAARMGRIRRSLRLELGGSLAATLLESFLASVREARNGDRDAARDHLTPVMDACRARSNHPGRASAHRLRSSSIEQVEEVRRLASSEA